MIWNPVSARLLTKHLIGADTPLSQKFFCYRKKHFCFCHSIKLNMIKRFLTKIFPAGERLGFITHFSYSNNTGVKIKIFVTVDVGRIFFWDTETTNIPLISKNHNVFFRILSISSFPRTINICYTVLPLLQHCMLWWTYSSSFSFFDNR